MIADTALCAAILLLAQSCAGVTLPVHPDPHFDFSDEESLAVPPPRPLDPRERRKVPTLDDFEAWLQDREFEDKAWALTRPYRIDWRTHEVRLVAGVFSRAGLEDKPYRDAIRRTWMNHTGVCTALAEADGPRHEECRAFVSFIVGNNAVADGVDTGERDLTVLNMTENMNCGKTMVWLQHAATTFPWATQFMKMDMDTFPRFALVLQQLPSQSQGCPNWYGGRYCDGDCCGVGPIRPWCPAANCGKPVDGNFMKYANGGLDCFILVAGGISILTRELALEISRPSGWWEPHAAACEPEDVTTGNAVHEYAARTGSCVATSELRGVRHIG